MVLIWEYRPFRNQYLHRNILRQAHIQYSLPDGSLKKGQRYVYAQSQQFQ